MAILDQRVVMVVFGDNANLSASVAKTIGALLVSELKENSVAGQIRRELEQFLEDQKEGYKHLYDPKVGLFYFGLDATKNRLFGWEDLDGNWKTGHVDYLVNEFRAPATFVVFRFGMPMDSIKNLGLKMKPYRTTDGRDLYTLAPWEGSAFQAMGLGLWLGELENPSWRTLMQNFVAIEIDFAKRQGLPGFLSESYTGRGVEYTGKRGSRGDRGHAQAANRRRGLALHLGRRIRHRAGKNREVPRRQLAYHLETPHRPRTMGRLQHLIESGHQVSDYGPYSFARARLHRRRV